MSRLLPFLLLAVLASPAAAQSPCGGRNQPSEAVLADCSRAIQNGGLQGRTLAEALLARGNAYQTRGIVQRMERRNPAAAALDFNRAIADFTAAIALDRGFAEAYVRRGIAHFEHGNFDPAIADFGEAIRLSPRHAGALNNRALTLAKKGEHRGAIADFTAALGINADPAAPEFEDSDPYYNRGISYLEERDYDRAFADFDAVIRRNPADPDGLYGRGRTHLALGRLDEAITDLNQSISLNSWPGALVARGEALEKKGDLKAALADFKKALATAPDDKEAEAGVKRVEQRISK